MDALDKKILAELQIDATQPLDELARRVGSSKTPVWNRIKRMREAGIIKAQVTLLDPTEAGFPTLFYVLVRTNRHDADWLEQFLSAVQGQPEILEAHRLAGEIDYILKVRVASPAEYDRFYQRLIAHVSIYNVTSLLSMEEIKATTALPIDPSAAKSTAKGREQ
ncbi:MAG: Lrp/AsnC family transcriptional regulator [Neomegalonema sp.]|nr:Lrp/AsnC family transcriptional regulator [Neomegalonema sp.]